MHNHDTPSDSKVNSESTTPYTCPMHQDIKQDGPGSCPKCGMNLVVGTSNTEDAQQMSCCHKPAQRTSPVLKKTNERKSEGILSRLFGRNK